MDGLDIQKQTFIDADEKTQKAMIYDLLKGINDRFDQHLRVCDKRHKCLDDRKQRNMALAVMSGGVGGFLAGLGKTIWSYFAR